GRFCAPPAGAQPARNAMGARTRTGRRSRQKSAPIRKNSVKINGYPTAAVPDAAPLEAQAHSPRASPAVSSEFPLHRVNHRQRPRAARPRMPCATAYANRIRHTASNVEAHYFVQDSFMMKIAQDLRAGNVVMIGNDAMVVQKAEYNKSG